MAKKIMIEDLLKFRFIENLQFDPSGKNYAYQVVHIDKKKDAYFHTLYVNRKAYRHDKDTSLLGWYDEDRLIIYREGKKDALSRKYLLLDINSGKTSTLFTTPLRISAIKVLDADTLVFTAGIDANEPDLYKAGKDKLEKYQKKQKEEADYEVLDEIPYWYNGAGFINKKRTALFLCHLKPFAIRRISDPLFSVSGLETHGKKIYYSGISYGRSRPLYEKIYVYDADTRKTSCIYDREDMMISALSCFNDRLYVSCTDGSRYGINETAAFHILEDGNLRKLESPDRSLYDSVATDTVLGGGKQRVVKDGFLYTLLSETDHVEIHRFDPKLKQKKLLSMPLIHFLDVGKDRIIFSGSDEKNLPELYEYSFRTAAVRKLTSFNGTVLKDRYVARPQEIRYVSEGYELNGWVLLPKDYDRKKKYPAVLDVHGGPRAIYSKAFFHEMQVWASAGYFVLFTNIKGSDGRGDAFADIRGAYGTVDFQNLMDFTDAVVKKYPAIDPKRLCETGGSYGGFMTNWIISHTDRFCCAASQRSIANWPGFAYLSDIGPYFAADQNGTDDNIKDQAKLWDRSPLKYVDQVKTPTLFIHSDQDYRCPLPEGMQMMQAMAERGIETRMVVFHGENHELSRSGKPKHRIRRLKEITGWFDRHAKP